MSADRRYVLILIMALLIGPAVAALGKGPESATLAGPGIDQPIRLFDDQASLTADEDDPVINLLRLTGLWAPGADPVKPPSDPGAAYTLTWVNMGPPGDSVEERTIYQYLFLDAPGGPFIHTPAQIGLDDWGPGAVGWFAANEELAEVIDHVIARGGIGDVVDMRPVMRTESSATAGDDRIYVWLTILASLGLGGFITRRSMSRHHSWLARLTGEPKT